MLWMGIWVHPYTVLPVQVGPKFWKIWVRLLGFIEFGLACVI